MDERLAKALEASKLLDTINQQKKLLQQQYDANLIHYENGCQFTSSKELLLEIYEVLMHNMFVLLYGLTGICKYHLPRRG